MKICVITMMVSQSRVVNGPEVLDDVIGMA
jgi:multisubunit Na+/H+ antiporter MnhF subunit